MGLWDILVPTEPGVLHNLIANPSFEYDNNEIDVARLNPPSGGSTVAEIASFRTLPANTGITYWTALKGAGVARSLSWASRGSYSLKINAGTSTNGGTVYDPRLSSPSPSVGVSVSQVVPSDNIPSAWSNIPVSRQFHVAVFGLTDTGMALANGISDTQFYYNTNSQDIVAYPTMDAKRGHTTPYFSSLPGITSNPSKSIKVVISGGQDATANATIRGWAVWYSMDTTSVKRYVLASIVPASANSGTSTTVFIHKVINQVNVDTVLTPTLCTGKIYMYPFAVDGEYIVKGVNTSFLTECPAGTDLYVLTDINQPNGEKQFLGRVADQGIADNAANSGTGRITATSGSTSITISGVPTATALVGKNLYTTNKQFIGKVLSASSATSATLVNNSTVTVNNVAYLYDGDNKITTNINSTSITVSGFPTAPFLVGRKLFTMKGEEIGTVVNSSNNTTATLASNALIAVTNESYQYSVATQTEIRIQQKATTTPIGFDFYRMVSTNVQSYPDNPIGAISAFSCNPSSNTNFLPASMGINCSAPYFGITNNTFANNTYKHHLYLDWYLSSPNLINPNATYTDTGARWKVMLVNITSDAIQPVGLTITTQRGNTSATISNASGFAQGDCIYTTNYEFVGEIKTINGNSITFYNLAFISLTASAFRKLAFNAGTSLGTLDASNATQLNAKRMGLRTKFLVTPPSGDTSRMQLRFQYTGTTSDADLYIDGIQFVDSGMIWRSYDYYGNSLNTYVNPPQFSDWNWDDVDFSYVDGDIPGAIWADTMPTQSGTYSNTFPYFTNDGAWHANFDEYDSSQSGHGMGTPRFRQQYQWRNEAKPVYGVSVPGLSQSSLLTQTFTTGFWASLDTDNINVVVEPTISGTGMPEIATTALEYGITDGGFVQRQVARMRNMQFNVTISAKSWVGLHANRRSLINLLKFDQLAQQGERMLRYTGADTPVVTRITYVGGLEFSGVQTQSFTEVLGLRFLSADPYFYTETPFTQDVSPSAVTNESSTVYYKLGNTSEWTPLSFHSNEMVLAADELLENSTSTPQLQSKSAFWDLNFSTSIPKSIGWLQSPSGNVSTLVVGGNFAYPFSTIAFFYVSGFAPDTKSPSNKVSFNTGLGTLTSNIGSAIVTFTDFEALQDSDVGKFLFVGGDYLGKIASVQSSTQCTLTENAVTAYASQPYQKVTLSTVDVNTNPTQVYGKQLFQLTGGSATENASVNAIYQESANSILVVGTFYQIIDFGDRTPNTNLNTSDYFTNDGKVNTTVRFGNNDISTQYPYFRVARFVMNDNGRIVAYPVDSQFEYDSASNTYRSLLFNQIGNQGLNAIAQSPSGYTFVGGDVNTSVQPLDNTLTNTFAPYPAYRGPSSFARTASQSNVYTINPNIAIQNNINSLEFLGSVGYQLGVSRLGLITTNPQSLIGSNLVEVSNVTDSSGKTYAAQKFTTTDIGKLIFTDTGIYIGQIYALAGGSSSSTVAILSSPAQVRVLNAGFSILGDIKTLTTDKKAKGSTVFAVVDSQDESELDFRASLYAYVPSTTSAGKMSFVSGSTSIATVGDTFGNALGINKTGKIQCSIASNIVLGDKTLFTPSMVGNILTTSNGTFIGIVQSVVTSTKLLLTRNAFTDVGKPVVSETVKDYIGQVTVPTTSGGVTTATINGSTTAGIRPDFSKLPAGTKYFYLYYPNNVNAQNTVAELCGVVSSFNNSSSPRTVTLTTNSLSTVNTSWSVGGSSFTRWFVTTAEIYESFEIISTKNVTDGDGYLLRAGQVQVIQNDSTTLPSGIARLRTPTLFTSSTTQYLGTNYNAYALYTSRGSNTSIVNFDSLISSTVLNSVVRRQFDASSSVKATAYDPTISTDAVTGFGNVFASYSFGTMVPVFNDGGTSGTLTVNGTSITVSSGSIVNNRHFYAIVENRVVYFGKTSNTNTLLTNYFGNVSNISTTWWSLPTNGTTLPDANSTKLVKGVGTIKGSGTSFTTFGNNLTAFDVGRSIYRYDSTTNTWFFMCVITAVSGANVTTTTAQSTGQGDFDYWLSGGSPVSSNRNVAWYPYQFAFPQGGTEDYEYLSKNAVGIEASSNAPTIETITVNGIPTVCVVIPVQALSSRTSPVPVSLNPDTYELYAYLQGVTPSKSNDFAPNVTGQWYLLGTIKRTRVNDIAIPVNSSGTTLISANTTSLTATLSGTITINAFQLVGYHVYLTNGTRIGVVEKALSNTSLQFRANASANATNVAFYFAVSFPYRTVGNIGTPLSIVRRVRIQTNVPTTYQQNDELYTYASASTINSSPPLQYLGTIQAILATGAGFVDVTYMPYWATPKTLLDSSNEYISGLSSDLLGNVIENTNGSATILKATKSLKNSVFANYFADALGVVSAVTPNPYNKSQTATVSFDGAADVFNDTLPSISQVEPVFGLTVNTTANSNEISYAFTPTTTGSSIRVTPTFTYTLENGVTTIQNKSVFRGDGQYMGSSTTAGTTGSLVFGNTGNGNTSSIFAYTEYSSLGTITFNSTSSDIGTYTQNGGIALSVLDGKALFRASDGAFIGIVNYTYSTNGIRLTANALATVSNGTFAYANASKLNTITTSTSSTSVTVVGGGYSYGSATSVTQFSLLNRSLFRYFAATNINNPFDLFFGNVTSVTQNATTNTATLTANSRGNVTNEPFIHMPFSGTGNTIVNNATLTTTGNIISTVAGNTAFTVAGTPTATSLVGSALYTNVGGLFIGIVRSASSATAGTFEEGAATTTTNALYRHASTPSFTLAGTNTPANVAIFRNTGEFMGIRRGNVQANFSRHPRFINTTASTYIYANTTQTGANTTAGNTITVALGSRSVTVAGTPTATDLVGSALYTIAGAYIGVVQSASSATSATLESGAVTAMSASTYSYTFSTVAITNTSTSSNIVTTIGTGISLNTFIGQAIFTLGTPTSGTDWNYVYIGTVVDVGTNQLILASNATININDPLGEVIIYAPSTIAMQLRTSNRQSTDLFNRISVTNGSNLVSVNGQPDAYTLVGKTLFQSDGVTSIGVVNSANSPIQAVLASNSTVTYSGTYQYISSDSISPLVTMTNAPVSQFANTTALWRTNGAYMGILGSAINNTQLNFSNMPYANTNNVDSYFIWADASNVSNVDMVHMLSYGSGINNELYINEGEVAGSYAGDNLINVGNSVYNVNSSLIGKIATVNTTTKTFTLVQPAQRTSLSSYFYAPNPNLYVFNGANTPANNEGRNISLVNNTNLQITINSSSGAVGVATSPNLIGSLLGVSNAQGRSYPTIYAYTENVLRYHIIPGDVMRSRDASDNNAFNIENNDIIGQIVEMNFTISRMYTVLPIDRTLTTQKVRVHRKHVFSEFIGRMEGRIVQKVTIGGIGGTQAFISGSGTRFDYLVYDYLNRNNMNGTGFYVQNDTDGSWSKIGTINNIVDSTTMVVTLSATTISDFSNESFVGGYCIRSMPGIGQITITETGIVRPFGTATKFAEQLYSGCVITVFSIDINGNTIVDGQYRVIDTFSNAIMQLASIDGSPYTNGLKNGRYFNIEYVYDEYPLLDTGLPSFVNTDWQPMGLTDGPIYDITTTQNGTLIISGNFTHWVDASYVGTTTSYDSVKRNVGRVARVTPLIANGKVFDSYASPIVGTSYANNGFNNTVNLVRDITDINPINGYVGSGDKLLIGGVFTGTLNNESVTHSLAYAEGSTISGNLQTIVNADVIFPVNRNSSNIIRSQTTAIASTNRMRKYAVNPITNVLDGISGSNIAIVHHGFLNNAVNVNTISSKMQYFSLRIRGNASVYPIIRIRNGASNKTIYELYQTETGARVRFDNSGLLVLAYEEIIINLLPGQRSITSNIRGNMISFISPTSNFVDWILLGANNSAGKYTQSYDDYRINIIGIHAQAGMNITINYNPRFWSFDANNMFFGTTKAGL